MDDMLAASGIQPGDRYRHAHGWLCDVVALAVDEAGQPCVVHRSLGPTVVTQVSGLDRFQERFTRERIAPRREGWV